MNSRRFRFPLRRQAGAFVAALTLLAGLGQNLGAAPAGQQWIVWKLKVAYDQAAVRTKPDLDAPVVVRLAKGTALTSKKAEGSWFQVSLPPVADGTVITGYIATNEVEIVEEIDTEPEKEKAPYKGIGLWVGIAGGFSWLPDGDFQTGSQGMFEEGVASILANNWTLGTAKNDPFPVGYDFELWLSYDLKPRFGILAGATTTSFRKSAYQEFETQGKMDFIPELRAWFLQIGVYHLIPAGADFQIRLSAGPALALAVLDSQCSALLTSIVYERTFQVHADITRLALMAAIGLEWKINNRTILYLNSRYRWAKFSKIAGSRILTDDVMAVSEDERLDGILYLVPGASSPVLTAYPEGTAPAGSREAVINMSGIDLQAGVRVKF